MTDTSYLYEYFVRKSPKGKTENMIKEKRGEAKQDKGKIKTYGGQKA